MRSVSRIAAVIVSVCSTFVLVPSVLAQEAAPSTTTVARSGEDVQAVRDELEKLRAEFAAVRQQYDDRLLALEQRLGQLAGGPRVSAVAQAAAAPDAPAAVNAPTPQGSAATPESSAAAGASKVFNPDTSVIGNFVGVGGKNPFSTEPAMQLSEAEVAFQAVVDPYARADFFLAAGPEGLDVEEGFITFTSLPSHLLLKVGKMRAQFGKVNTLHTHAMPTVDRPLVTQNLVGGEEGLADSGMSLSRLFPNSAMYLEATGEVYTGNSGVFSTSQRSRLNYVGRLRAYRDITESMNVDLGTSFAFGPTDGAIDTPLLSPDVVTTELNKRLVGIDATFRYRPLRRAIYQRFNVRTEMIWSRQDLSADAFTTAFGMYGLAEYQFARRWYAGARLDRSGRALDASLVDTGGSFFVTFWPTEFAQIRSQYRRTNFAEGTNANELLFQVNFAIGAHGAHAF
jgi:hypothetical protein